MVYSRRYRELLALIDQEKRGSLIEVAKLAGRGRSGLTRGL